MGLRRGLEVAHLPYRKGKSYEDYLGDAGLAKLGDERWERHVQKVCDLLRAALLCDGIVLGGGNARKLVNLPDAATRGSNENAIQGGVRMWERVAESTPPEFTDARSASETIAPGGERRVSIRRASDRAAFDQSTRVTKAQPAKTATKAVAATKVAAKKAVATKSATTKRPS